MTQGTPRLDAHPHPMWKRTRDEAPPYYDDEHDLYSRELRLEGRIGLEGVLTPFSRWTTGEGRMQMMHRSTVRGPEKLPVIVEA